MYTWNNFLFRFNFIVSTQTKQNKIVISQGNPVWVFQRMDGGGKWDHQ